MSKDQIRLLRDAVIAQIEYAVTSMEEGSDGCRVSAVAERKLAENAWEVLLAMSD